MRLNSRVIYTGDRAPLLALAGHVVNLLGGSPHVIVRWTDGRVGIVKRESLAVEPS